MRPHRIHVESGPEYPGETYIWCECETRAETTSLANSYMLDSQDRRALFDDGDEFRFGSSPAEDKTIAGRGLASLLEFLKLHKAI